MNGCRPKRIALPRRWPHPSAWARQGYTPNSAGNQLQLLLGYLDYHRSVISRKLEGPAG
jgi:hypothetical protein